MATDFGTDVSAVPDLDPSFASRSGRAVVSEALVRRLSTPRGGLHYDDTYGYDLRLLIGEAFGPADAFRVQSAISAECEKDPRVLSARAAVAFNAATSTLTVTIAVQTAAGPFTLTLAVTALSVTLLAGSR